MVMTPTERINQIARRYGEYSETTLDLLAGIVAEFDIYREIEQALAGKASRFTEDVADAVSYTRSDGGSIFDCDKER